MTKADQIRTATLQRLLNDYLAKPTPPRAAPQAAGSVAPEVEALARWLDTAFEIPGLRFRFGLDSILGLIPGVGDTITSLASLYILHAAARQGVPRATMARMGINVAIDYVVGAVPVVGDVFDLFWKSNQKNVTLLRRHLAETPTERRRSSRGDQLFVAAMIGVLLLALVGSAALALFALSGIFAWLAG